MRRHFPFPEYPGIYLIWNKEEETGYVGSGYNLFRRLVCGHYKDLHQYKDTIKLQHAWNKYGEEAFEVSILEVIYYKLAPKNKKKRLKLRKRLVKREQFWIDYYDATEDGYNICKFAYSTLGTKRSKATRKKQSEIALGRTFSKETRKKMSKAQKDRKRKPFSKEHKKHLSESKIGHKVSKKTRKKLREANLGHKVSKTTRRKISIGNKGQKRSKETKKKLREANLGKHPTKEARRKMSESHLGHIPWNKGIKKFKLNAIN